MIDIISYTLFGIVIVTFILFCLAIVGKLVFLSGGESPYYENESFGSEFGLDVLMGFMFCMGGGTVILLFYLVGRLSAGWIGPQ